MIYFEDDCYLVMDSNNSEGITIYFKAVDRKDNEVLVILAKYDKDSDMFDFLTHVFGNLG